MSIQTITHDMHSEGIDWWAENDGLITEADAHDAAIECYTVLIQETEEYTNEDGVFIGDIEQVLQTANATSAIHSFVSAVMDAQEDYSFYIQVGGMEGYCGGQR